MKNLYNKILVTVGSLFASSAAFSAAVTYDAADAVTSIGNIGTTAVAVMGAFITLAITVMFYRKIRGVISKG